MTRDIENKVVTFIIPTIGRKTLARSIDCLIQQTIPNWKAIIIFDGITPTFTTADERIKIITCEKLGTGHNSAGNVRNYGMKLVDTEWIAFLDDDDTISNNYLEYFYKELELSPKLDTIIFRMYHHDQGVLPRTDKTQFEINNVGISFAMKKKIFDDGIIFIPSSAEDFYLLNNIRSNKYKMVISPYTKYFVKNVLFSNNHGQEGIRAYINC